MSAPGATSTAHIICRNFRGQSGHNCRLLIEAAVAVTRDIAPAQDRFGSSAAGRRAQNMTARHAKAASQGTKRDIG
jgi:hypothetical protein